MCLVKMKKDLNNFEKRTEPFNQWSHINGAGATKQCVFGSDDLGTVS
jgi:hypothetical protein